MSIVGDIKSVAGDLQKLGNIDLYNRLISIQEKVMEVVDRDVELKEENNKLKKEIETGKILEYQNNVYWLKTDKPGETGPYCSKCYDTDRRLVHLHQRDDPRYLQCPSCRIMVQKRW